MTATLQALALAEGPTTADSAQREATGLGSAGLPAGHFFYAVLGASVDLAVSFTSLRRFWTVAASRNSSDALANPRKRSLVSFRCRLRCEPRWVCRRLQLLSRMEPS